MNRRLLLVSLLFLTAAPAGARAQEHPMVQRAQQAYEALDFAGAITNAQRALQQRLTREDRIIAYELLGYSYGALDSTRQAVDAFRELIFLDPDREPDVDRVSPRITSLYASALGQVLVVRGVGIDSVSFIAGQGIVPIRYEVSRASRAITRVVGQGLDVTVDSQIVSQGSREVFWRAVAATGDPVPAGDYQVVVTAIEGGNEFAAAFDIGVAHAAVDTIPHLDSLPGYQEQPEYESPGRNWRPLGLAVLYTGLVAGAAVALENQSLDIGKREELAGVSLLAIITGVVMSVKKPDPQPVQANILYNQLLREELARRNAQIVEQNTMRRRQTRLTVQPAGGVEP
jgi:hypothetical protein